MAGVEGVEPSHTAPETAVLPLDDTPVRIAFQAQVRIIPTCPAYVNTFFEKIFMRRAPAPWKQPEQRQRRARDAPQTRSENRQKPARRRAEKRQATHTKAGKRWLTPARPPRRRPTPTPRRRPTPASARAAQSHPNRHRAPSDMRQRCMAPWGRSDCKQRHPPLDTRQHLDGAIPGISAGRAPHALAP